MNGQLVLRLLYGFCICLYHGLCIPTYHVRNNNTMYIVAMVATSQYGWLLCLATMSSQAQLQVRDRYREVEVT